MSEKQEKLEIGSIVDGKVVNIKPFGAIVVLPDNTQGLVHISHISSEFVQNISDYVAVGDVVRVKLVSIDPVTKKISLSMKEAARQETQSEAPPQTFERAKPQEPTNAFEDKVKEWIKISNERHAGLNKRNKRR